MMLKEAIDTLVGLGESLAQASDVTPNDPRLMRLVVPGRADPLLTLPRAIPPRRHRVDSIVDLADLAAVATAQDCDDVVIWIEPERVEIVFDSAGYRHETATRLLRLSRVFVVLREIEAQRGGWLDQKAFLRLLRIDLAGTLPAADLVEKVKRVRFEAGSIVEGRVTRTSESLGREIASRVEGDGEIPESVTLSVPVFVGQDVDLARYSFRCLVDVDPQTGQFRLVPYPDEVSRVLDMALADLRGKLVDRLRDLKVEVPVYYGKS